jgi:hypothetical protein
MTEQTTPEAPEAAPRQWEIVGLGGARWIVTFRTRQSAATAVSYLMNDGHGHHFAVVGEGYKVIMSKMATECLTKEFGPDGQPPEPRERKPGPDLGDDPDGNLEGADYPPFPAGSQGG